MSPLTDKLVTACHLTGAEPKPLSHMFSVLVDELLSGPDTITSSKTILAPWLGMFTKNKKLESADVDTNSSTDGDDDDDDDDDDDVKYDDAISILSVTEQVCSLSKIIS